MDANSVPSGKGPPEGAFPLPTEALGLDRLWLWSLPGRAITWLSISTFALAALGLSATGELRVLFRVPGSPSWFAAGATLLAALVAAAGRARPGRLLPRLWPLGLAAGAGLLTVLAQAPDWRDEPLLHVSVAASAASAAVLSLRLVHPSATSRWTEWVVLVASVLAALLMVPGLVVAAGAASTSWQTDVSAAVAGFEATARGAGLASHGDGGRAEGETDAGWKAAAERIEALAGLHPRRFMQRRQLWRAAVALGRERELAAAAEKALTAVGAALSSERAPSLGQLSWPAVWFDRERKIWVEDPRFGARSRAVGGHYRELGRLLMELRPLYEAASAATTKQLAARFAEQRGLVQRRLGALRSTWTDGWVVARVPAGTELAGGEIPTLGELLEQPVLKTGKRAFRPVELWNLMELPGRDAWPVGAQPGCLRHRYEEEGIGLLRTDCFAFRPSAMGEGAELLIEVRLVYRTESRLLEFHQEKPHEIYFLFPVPQGSDAEAYQAGVMETFSRAVELTHPRLGLAADRSGTAMKGFRLTNGRRQLRVHSRPIPYAEGRRAIEVRTFWE